jgi:hypothetical protein
MHNLLEKQSLSPGSRFGLAAENASRLRGNRRKSLNFPFNRHFMSQNHEFRCDPDAIAYPTSCRYSTVLTRRIVTAARELRLE